MSIYLEDHPPARRQFKPRTRKPTGLIVVHTAESVMDTVGPDTGAENVARFIARRGDPGSYHTLVDADSRVRLVRYDQEAYGDGTGSNPIAVHISAACAAADWPRMTPTKREAFVVNLALAAADAADWLKDEHGITVPARYVTKAESDRGLPGFISHGDRDPARRSDPGDRFPWAMLLDEFTEAVDPGPSKEEALRKRITRAIQAAKKADRPHLVERLRRIRNDV